MSCVITASAPTNDHAQIRFSTLGICKQQDNAMHSRCITVYSPLVNYTFETNHFCHAPTKFTCQ